MGTVPFIIGRRFVTPLAFSEKSWATASVGTCLKFHFQLSRGIATSGSLWSKPLKRSNLLEVKDNEVYLDGNVTVKNLAKAAKTSTGAIINVMKDLGEDVSAGINSNVDYGVADFILSEHGLTAIFPKLKDLEEESNVTEAVDDVNVLSRAPIVTVMGHVDHGKTTLLDTLRKTSVAQGEAGGITQHIGAFSVVVPSGKTITFIDTPGHAAFVTMRARGVMATDIVVLVVAADDGVQGQTVECIQHAKDAGVPLIVAINKIDKAPHRVQQVKEELLTYGLQVEEMGGDIPCIEISALKGENIDQLEEVIILLADVADLKASRSCRAHGIILESQTTREKGQVATVLVQRGTLKRGSCILAGSAIAKVRQLLDHRGKPVTEALPSDPVQVLGWRTLPKLGDQVMETESEAKAKDIANTRSLRAYLESADKESTQDPGHIVFAKEDRPTQRGVKKSHTPFRVLRRRLAASKDSEQSESKQEKLEIILKADVNGSLEALLNILNNFYNEDLTLSVLSSGVGSIADSDLHLAETTKALLYGFNINTPKGILKTAEKNGVNIKSYNVIYKLLDDLKEEIESRLPKLKEENELGEARVLQVFHLTGTKKATVAGCRVKSGTISLNKNNVIRIIRDKKIIHEGPLKMLKHGKEDIQVVNEGKECGISLQDFVDFNEGDVVQCISVTHQKQTVNWKTPGK